MPDTTYRGRRAVSIENSRTRVTVLVEGGHVAEILDKATHINPLWTPPWPSIEPSTYSLATHPEYGADSESKLLAGIMGHNLCADIFGGPSPEEAAGGLTVHGEASVARYEIAPRGTELTMYATLPNAQLRVERTIRLWPDRAVVDFTESLENLSTTDRPVAWTEHVTIGPPFLERGSTEFRASATRSKVFEGDFGPGGYQKPGAEFVWPHVPRAAGGASDLRVYNRAEVSSGFTTHLMDPAGEHAWFSAFAPKSKTAFGYIWRRDDFPWLDIWEENHSRTAPPWGGKTLARGMEFGASPMPETRRKMIERGTLFGVPGFRWIPARQKVEVRYRAIIGPAGAIPKRLVWDAHEGVRFA